MKSLPIDDILHFQYSPFLDFGEEILIFHTDLVVTLEAILHCLVNKRFLKII